MSKDAVKATPRTQADGAVPPVHIGFLDGIRALAALWVVVGHARLFAIGWEAQHGLLGIVANGASYLHQAVNIFIVLSGFCLALPLVRRRDRTPDSLPKFFVKRARRILPPYYAAVVICLFINAIVPLTLWARIQPVYSTSQMPSSVLWTHLLLLQDYFPELNLINGPFWSIAVEWHIYFLFPFLAFVLRRFGRMALLAGGAFLTAGLMYFSSHVHGISSPWYTGLFTLGMFAADAAWDAPLLRRPTTQKVGWGAFVVLFVICVALTLRFPIFDTATMLARGERDFFIDTATGAFTAAALFLLASVGTQSALLRPLHRFFSWRPLVALGTFSYSLYLMHLPIQTLLYQLVIEGPLRTQRTTVKFFLLAVVGTAIIIPLCYLFFRCFELPFMRLRRKETHAEEAREAALSPGI